MGFSYTRLSGTGACDLIDILLMPTTQEGTAKPFSSFSHEEEEAHPGYYKVRLGQFGIIAELSATTRTGIHQYTFPQGKRQRLYLDIEHSAPKGSWNRRIIQSQICLVNPTTIEGWRIITGWAKLRRVYFHLELSRPVTSHLLIDGSRQEKNATLVNGSELKGFFDFDQDRWQTAHLQGFTFLYLFGECTRQHAQVSRKLGLQALQGSGRPYLGRVVGAY